MTQRAEEATAPPLKSSRVGPDVFSYYGVQVAELLSQKDMIPEAANISSTEAIGASLSTLKKEKLNALLRQCVLDVIPEVDEMQLRTHRMSQLTKPINAEPVIPEDPTSKLLEENKRVLMMCNPSLVKEKLTKLSKDLYSKLDNMKQQLEKVLGNVATTCRPMSRGEKRDLQNSIKELPGENLNRIVRIIEDHYAALGKELSNEVVVNMEEEDDVLLWRLHFYVAAVKNARDLAS